jgi:hypothetical protein
MIQDDNQSCISNSLSRYIRGHKGLFQCDPVLFRGHMSDTCPRFPREVYLLDRCLSIGISDTLARYESQPSNIVIDSLVDKLHNAYMVEKRAARWSVLTWCSALLSNNKKGLTMISKTEIQVSVSNDAELEQALREPEPNTVILLKTGTFRQSLIIDCDIKIRGTGKPNETVLEFNDSRGIAVLSEKVCLENMFIRSDDINSCTLLDIAFGKVSLKNCYVRGRTHVHGASAHLKTKNCFFHEEGILVFDEYAGGFITETTIESMLCISKNASPVCDTTKISGPVILEQSGTGTFKACNITSAFTIMSGSSPVFESSHFNMKNDNHLLINSLSTVMANDCQFMGNQIEVTSARVTFENSMFEGGDENAIRFKKGSTVYLKHCNIKNYQNYGINILSGSNVTVEKSTISDTNGVGLNVSDKGSTVHITESDITRSTQTGIVVSKKASVSLDKCRINRGLHNGVHLKRKGYATFRKTDISGNEGHGVIVESSGHLTGEQSSIEQNRQSGLHVKRGKVFLEKTVLRKNIENGLIADRGSRVNLSDCIVKGNGANGLISRKRGRIILSDSTVIQNGITGILVTKKGRVECHKCQIIKGRHAGIVIENGIASLIKSILAENAGPGMVITNRGKMSLISSCIEKSAVSPVLVQNRGRMQALNSIFKHNSAVPIECRDNGHVHLRDCQIKENDSPGVIVGSGCVATFIKSSVSNNIGDGIIVSRGGSLVLSKAAVLNNNGHGIQLNGGKLISVFSSIVQNDGFGISGKGIMGLFVNTTQNSQGAKSPVRFTVIYCCKIRNNVQTTKTKEAIA